MANSIFRQLQRTSKTILLLRQQPIIKPTIHNLKHSSYYIPAIATSDKTKLSPDARLLNCLRYELRYEIDSSPLEKPLPEFNSFSVDEKPTEQWIRLIRKFGENEEIKVEVTMLDTYTKRQRIYEEVKLYLSMLVCIRKGEGNDVLEFACSVWPDRIKIREVYTRNEKRRAGQSYMGPGFRDLDDELQKSFYEYLEERGIDEKLATFLHKYMKNKEKNEYVRWMEQLNSFMEKKEKNDKKIIK